MLLCTVFRVDKSNVEMLFLYKHDTHCAQNIIRILQFTVLIFNENIIHYSLFRIFRGIVYWSNHPTPILHQIHTQCNIDTSFIILSLILLLLYLMVHAAVRIQVDNPQSNQINNN